MQVRRVLPPDAIESIDEPTFTGAYDGDPDEEVVVVEPTDGPARAYPLLVLNHHEVVNDAVAEEPIAVTWCPLCGSAVVYDRVVDGRTLTFGVSGKLAEDDLVLYDRETDSEWKQSTGACIAGQLSGETLSVRPASLMRLGRFRETHPDGRVLDPPVGEHGVVNPTGEGAELATETRAIDYTVDHFADYVEGDWIGSRSRSESRSWARTDLAAKEVVLGLGEGESAIAVPTHAFDVEDPISVSVAGRDIVCLRADDLHAYEAPAFSLEPLGGGEYRGDGTVWDGATGRAADGRALERVPARRLFAFAWQTDHGPEAFYLPG